MAAGFSFSFSFSSPNPNNPPSSSPQPFSPFASSSTSSSSSFFSSPNPTFAPSSSPLSFSISANADSSSFSFSASWSPSTSSPSSSSSFGGSTLFPSASASNVFAASTSTTPSSAISAFPSPEFSTSPLPFPIALSSTTASPLPFTISRSPFSSSSPWPSLSPLPFYRSGKTSGNLKRERNWSYILSSSAAATSTTTASSSGVSFCIISTSCSSASSLIASSSSSSVSTSPVFSLPSASPTTASAAQPRPATLFGQGVERGTEVKLLSEVGKGDEERKILFLGKSGDLSGTKRKAVTATMGAGELPSTRLKKHKEKWTCSTCQVSVGGERNINDHLQGKRHKTKSRALGLENNNTGPCMMECGNPTQLAELTNNPVAVQGGQVEVESLQNTKACSDSALCYDLFGASSYCATTTCTITPSSMFFGSSKSNSETPSPGFASSAAPMTPSFTSNLFISSASGSSPSSASPFASSTSVFASSSSLGSQPSFGFGM